MTPRVVAELGRAETPQESAERKAAASRAYRSSQTVRNLIAALLATLIVVTIVIFIVPRGNIPEGEPIDIDAVAERLAAAENRTIVTPDLPPPWRINAAGIDSEDGVRAWTIVAVPTGESGFVTISQGFDADAVWVSRQLAATQLTDTVVLDGVVWDRYVTTGSAATKNIAHALVTHAGADTILIFGSADEDTLLDAAGTVTDDILVIQAGAQ